MNNQQKKMHPILWFLFAIIIPVLIAISLTIVVLSAAGFNVVGWMKETGSNIPVLSSVIKTDEEIKHEQIEQKLQDTITSQSEEIEQLTQHIENLEANIDQLEKEIIKLENKNQNEEKRLEEDEENLNLQADTIKKLSASFKKMNKKKAALIFQDLNTDIAISLLHELSNDVRGEVLEAMEPKQAAELSEKFIDSLD